MDSVFTRKNTKKDATTIMNTEELRKIIRQKTLNREDSSLLKYVLAESERYDKPPVSVIEKLIIDNEESYRVSNRPELLTENQELKQYLPSYISVEDIKNSLSGLNLDNSGKSIGIAIKHLKSLNLPFRNEDVRTALLS